MVVVGTHVKCVSANPLELIERTYSLHRGEKVRRMVDIKKVGTAFSAAARRPKAKGLSLPSQEWRAPILRPVLLVPIKPVGARDVFVSVSKLLREYFAKQMYV